VARMAKAAGLPAPVNATVYAALKPYLGGAR
jgi:ketopantoate reductase